MQPQAEEPGHGAFAEAFAAFAEPLLDQTDGSLEQLNKAFAISQLCYNLALLPEDDRSAAFTEMQQTLKMDDEEFDDFRRSIPRPHDPTASPDVPVDAPTGPPCPSAKWPLAAGGSDKGGARRNLPGTDRYAPCPCNSGEKLEFCTAQSVADSQPPG